MSTNQKTDLTNLGVTVRGIVGQVSTFNTKDNRPFFRIKIWDGGGQTLEIVSDKGDLDRGAVYCGKVSLAVREFRGRPMLSCFENERLA